MIENIARIRRKIPGSCTGMELPFGMYCALFLILSNTKRPTMERHMHFQHCGKKGKLQLLKFF